LINMNNPFREANVISNATSFSLCAILAAAMTLGTNWAWATQSPPGCVGAAVSVTMARDATTTPINVTNGAVATIVSTIQNPVSSLTNCDVILVNGLIFFCPGPTGQTNGGATTVLLPAGTILPAGSPQLMFTNQCTINVNPGVLSAPFQVFAPGALTEDNPLQNDPAIVGQSLSLNVFTPCIHITKACANTCTPYGQPISFTGSVTNCGDAPLNGVLVTDNPTAAITFSTTTFLGLSFPAAGGGILTNGDSVTYSGSYTPSGNLCGPFTDTATVTATNGFIGLPPGISVSDTAQAVCHVSTSPSLRLTKDCYKISGSASTPVGGKNLVAGDSYIEVFTVTNNGNVPLSGVTIHDVSTNCSGTVRFTQDITVGTGNLDPGAGLSVTNGPLATTGADCPCIGDFATVTGNNVCPADATCPSSATASAGPATCSLNVLCQQQCVCVNPGLGLGAAANTTVLELDAASVSITGPPGGVLGDISIGPGGKLSLTGSEFITGKVRLAPGATFSDSSSGIVGGVLSNVDLSAEINAAYAAAAADAKLPCTQTFTTLDGRSVTHIVGVSGLNVICVRDVVLSGSQILLTGPSDALFIFNVTGKFVLTGGGAGPQIRVGAGLQPSAVLYNIIGNGPDVAFSGGGGGVNCCAAIVDGTLLAPFRKINLSPGLVNGEVISGLNISIVSGSSVRCPCPPLLQAPRTQPTRWLQ
jgi:uncharacterized repeat protein (TIGR01451 family)